MKKIKETNKPLGKWRMMLFFLHGSIRFFVFALLFVIAATLLEMVNPRIISFTVDSIIGDSEASLPAFLNSMIEAVGGMEHLKQNIWILALLVVAVALPAVVFRYFFRVFNARGAETLVKSMRDKLFSKIQRLPFSWHMKNQTGDIIQRCTSDVDMVKRFLSDQLTAIIRIVILIALALSFMYRMNIAMSVVATVFIPVIIAYSAFFHRKISAHFRECDENEGKLSAIAQENMTGVRVVRAFGRERSEQERFSRQNHIYARLWMKLSKFFSAFWGVGDLISGLQVMLIIVLGVFACNKGTMTAGDFIAYISYNSMLIWPIRYLGRVISEMSKAGVSFDRLSYIMNSEEECDRPDAGTPPMDRDIAFEDVSYAYDGAPELLRHISFRVKAGSTVGILGGTGSGKSTLMHLLNRLYDLPAENGKITVGGVDIADMKAEWVRRNVGMVLQEPYLFSRTLGENIGIARESVTLTDIRNAAGVACLTETIDSFTDGYDTPVGERGVTLSGGQKQRTAIARMLVQKTPIMVFDDSLSAVDAETDARIRASLTDQMAGATVFLISHRTSTLMHADQIAVLDRGTLAEIGTHDELMSREGGIYRRIYELQSGGQEVTDCD